MKIGILTFHLVPNYGAVLQAFALMKYLQQKGHDASIIDYKCPGNNDVFLPKNLYSIKRVKRSLKSLVYFVVMRFLSRKDYEKKYEAFDEFQNKYLRITEMNVSSFDAVFCGSDQIWNPAITKGVDKVFFGFIENVNISKRIAYAASSGDIKSLSVDEKKILISYAKQMDWVSVRESPFNEFLNQNHVESQVVLDPTFLLTKDDYIKYFASVTLEKKDYILVYELHEVPLILPVVKKIAKEKNLDIVYLCGYKKMSILRHNRIYTAGPLDFIKYMTNAKYVVTNSFHGLAFSLIFEKDFNVCLPLVRTERLTNLLESLSLSDRIVYQQDAINTNHIDYTVVNRKKSELVELSKQFVDKALM